ncbi:MAG: A/G-specific adenine glycosylase [Deltaproteobacteria bacterium HGW-Deltaproteobacteria-4]|nr:MAG: A/G-specific adenine glycosylase [Deltaproteobacteria bacterium HGW-Deltaproteobacteria-4]
MISIAPLLLAWYGQVGRDLPWRHTSDPYCIWLSEIMLQQTTVTAVIPYYQRFLARFPAVATLASAPIEAVIDAWAGLGYYSRARNLHAAAQRVMNDYGGSFPSSLEELTDLPGVGRSTAGAIRAIAFGERGVILDGNVRRVLVRLLALDGDPRSSAAEKILWQSAEAVTPPERAGDYAQAIMDLGATCCTPTKPTCSLCPLAAHCHAFAQGRQDALPERRKTKAVPTVLQVALLLERDNRWRVERRPLSGMLGGLWEFPTCVVAVRDDPTTIAAVLAATYGVGDIRETGRVAHAYSHFKVDLRLFSGQVEEWGRVAEGKAEWVDAEVLRGLSLHGAHKKALKFIAT